MPEGTPETLDERCERVSAALEKVWRYSLPPIPSRIEQTFDILKAEFLAVIKATAAVVVTPRDTSSATCGRCGAAVTEPPAGVTVDPGSERGNDYGRK